MSPACACPTGGTFYSIAAAWRIWTAVIRGPTTARSVEPGEREGVRVLPGLDVARLGDAGTSLRPAANDLVEYHELLEGVAACPDHGLRGARFRLYFNSQTGEEWSITRQSGPEGSLHLERTGGAISELGERARRAATLAKESILRDPGPVDEYGLRALKLCRSYLAEVRAGAGTPQEPIARGDLVQQPRLLWHCCGKTRVCPQCQTETALDHFRTFLFASRSQIRAAGFAGNVLGWRTFTTNADAAKEFVERLPAVAIRILRPSTGRVTVIYIAKVDGLGSPVEHEQALWALFEPPSLAAFTALDGAGWSDPRVIARLALPLGARLYRHHTPHIRGAVELAGLLGLEVPHTMVPMGDTRQLGTAVGGTAKGTKQQRAKARQMDGGWLGFGPDASLSDESLLQVVAEVESSVGLVRPPRVIRPAVTVALAAPDPASFKVGRFNGRVTHRLSPPRKVSAAWRDTRALRRNVPGLAVPPVVGSFPDSHELLIQQLEVIDRAAVEIEETLVACGVGEGGNFAYRWEDLRGSIRLRTPFSQRDLDHALVSLVAQGRVISEPDGLIKRSVAMAEPPSSATSEGPSPLSGAL